METLTVLCKRPVGVGEDKAGQKEAEAKADEGLSGEEFFFLTNKQQHELHERSEQKRNSN